MVDVETKAVAAGAGTSRREVATARAQAQIHLWTLSPRRPPAHRRAPSPPRPPVLTPADAGHPGTPHPVPGHSNRYPSILGTIMSELLSLSVLQLLSVLSFLTSVLAVVCVGSGSLHRLAHRVDPGVDTPTPDMDLDTMALTSGKHPLWNWSGLPVSFSLDTLIGEEEKEPPTGYVGGTELTRMDWQVSAAARSRIGASTFALR